MSGVNLYRIKIDLKSNTFDRLKVTLALETIFSIIKNELTEHLLLEVMKRTIIAHVKIRYDIQVFAVIIMKINHQSHSFSL